MKEKFRDTDFLYASARVRSLENGLFGSEKTDRILDAKSGAEIISLLVESGFTILYKPDDEGNPTDKPDVEATLDAYIADSFALLGSFMPTGFSLEYLRLPYDCNNIKAAIKERFSEREIDGVHFACAKIPYDMLKASVASGDFSLLPENMAAAAADACEVYAKTKDPSKIDIPLDKACYADMLAGVPDKFLKSLIMCRIDLQNIITCVRVMRMGDFPTAKIFLGQALIEGGTIGLSTFESLFEAGESKLAEALSSGEYSPLAAELESGKTPLSVIERTADDFYMSRVKKAKLVPFGAEVCGAYLIAVDASVKNIRIVYNSKTAGLPADAVRARVRASYV